MAKQKSIVDELEALLSKAKLTINPEPEPARAKDISKAVALFQKSQELLAKSQQLHAEAMAILTGGNGEGAAGAPQSEEYQANAAKYPDAPYGRKLDGTPKKPSGKKAAKLKETNPELFADVPSSEDVPDDAQPNELTVTQEKPSKSKRK